MRKAIIILALLGSFAIFAATIDLFEAALMFVLFGILPGSDASLSANQMLTLYVAAGGGIVGYMCRNRLAGLIETVRMYRPAQQSQLS